MFFIGPGCVDHVEYSRLVSNSWSFNNRSNGRPAELEEEPQPTSGFEVSNSSTALCNGCAAAAACGTSHLNLVILVKNMATDNVAERIRPLEDVTQAERALSLGTGALRVQFDWQIDIADPDNLNCA